MLSDLTRRDGNFFLFPALLELLHVLTLIMADKYDIRSARELAESWNGEYTLDLCAIRK